MSLRRAARRLAQVAGLTGSLLVPLGAAADPVIADVIDQQSLERALFLCQWKASHDVPDSAPVPAVCRSAAVSIADALLQDKQWWTFWVRLNSEAAVKANQQFSTDFVAFQARQRLNPSLAQQLLPPGMKLPHEDWRARVVQDLVQNKPAAPLR